MITEEKLRGKVLDRVQEFFPLDELIRIPETSALYVYGGLPRDCVLNKPSGDIDIRVAFKTFTNKHIVSVETLLHKYTKIIGGHRIPGYQVKFVRCCARRGTTTQVFDFSIVQEHLAIVSDFTINSMHVDIKQLKIRNFQSALRDLKCGVIRGTKGVSPQFKKYPIVIFRALTCACRFDFSITPHLLKSIQLNGEYAVNRLLKTISDSPKSLMSSIIQKELFAGFRYDSARYLQLLMQTGLSEHILTFMSRYLHVPLRKDRQDVSKQTHFVKAAEKDIEIFLSLIVDQFDVSDTRDVYKQITHYFRIIP